MTLTSARIRISALAIAGALSLAACSSASDDASTPTESDSAANSAGISVITTTTMLGSIAGDITTCAGGTTTALLPIGVDPHEYAPASSDVANMLAADIVFANGLGLEEGLEDALATVAADGGTVIEIGPQLNPTPDSDPHVWLDMDRMETAATIMGNELASITGDNAFESCGTEVSQKIQAAEAEVIATLDEIPADRRVLITDHDSLEYFADRYNMEIAGTVIPSATTLAQASSADLANVVETMRQRNLTTIFTNTSTPADLSEAITAELGEQNQSVSVIPLYIESIGEPGSGAEDYIGMMRTNAQLIADNLRP